MIVIKPSPIENFVSGSTVTFLPNLNLTPVSGTYYLVADSVTNPQLKGYENSILLYDGVVFRFQTVKPNTTALVAGDSYTYIPGVGWLLSSSIPGSGGGLNAGDNVSLLVNDTAYQTASQVLATIEDAVSNFKTRLTADLSLYVNSVNGVDVSGQIGQGTEAYRSLNFAYQDVADIYDLDKFKVTIFLEDGIHVLENPLDVPSVDSQNLGDRSVEVRNLNGIDDAVLQLNFSAPGDAFYFRAVQHRAYFGNMTIEAIANVDSVFEVGELCNVRLEDLKFRGTFNLGCIRFYNGVQGNYIGDIVLDGVSCQYFIYLGKSSGSTFPDGFNLTIPAGKTATFTTAFLKAYGAGTGIAVGNNAIFQVLGTALGKKFEITNLTHIEFGTNDGNPDLNIFPGDKPGVIIPAGYGSLVANVSLKDIKVSVADYGVIGDGVADDTAAIQAALDKAGQLLDAKQSLGLSGQTIVEIPGGTFKISTPLTVRNGTTLKGQTQAPPYPNRLSGFKSNDNLFTGTEIVCSSDFIGESAIILEPDNTNLENIILDGHSIPCGTTWTQVNVTTAQGKWVSTAFIKFPVQDPTDPRIQSFKFDNVEVPYFRVGEYGEFQLQAIGGSGSYTFSLLSGSLPAGLTLSASGLISGTPTQLETVFPVFNINDGSNDFSRSFTMGTILDEIKTRDILPPTAGDSYSFQLESQYGVAGLIWEAIALPDWLSLSTNGFLTNNRPITTDDVAFFEFKVELYSAGATLLDKRAFKSEVRYADGSVRIFGEQRLKPQQGVAFSYQYLGNGGYGDYTWSINAARSTIAGNATPVTATSPFSGLTLNTDTGEITGTATTTGTNTYYLRATSVTDPTLFFEGLFYIEAVSAGATPRIYTRSFKTATKGQPYSFQFNLEDIPSAQPYIYEAINLPTGLSMDSSGLIAGTPTGANFVNGVQIQWSDSVKDCAIRGFRSGGGIFSSKNPSNVHRISGCLISVCDSGIKNISQMWDSHFTNLYIFNCRAGLDLGGGSAGLTFSDTRIEYIHEDGINMTTSNENDFSAIYFDTCGWSSIRAKDCRNLLVTGCRSFRSGRNIRGVGTRLNPKANPEYSNHFWLEDCDRATFTGNTLDIGTKDGGDGIYLSDHFADNLRPSYGFRIHNCPELTVVGNNLTGCLQAFSANLSDFGENNFHGWNIANNAQSDRELVGIDPEKIATKISIPNNCFSIWQRDRAFNIPVATDNNPTTFAIADGWFLKRGGNGTVNQTISVTRQTDGKIGSGYYLRLQKAANTTPGTSQTLELNNYLATNLKDTSNRAIILSYYARSGTNCSLGVKVSQYPDSSDNGFVSYQFQDNNKTLSTQWKRYQHYFQLQDLTGIKFGAAAILNIIFRCDRNLEAISLDLTGVQIDFVDQAPFAQELREKSFAEELAFAQLRYQKSKTYEQYFPSWSGTYRYDVNGANWNPGFINQLAITTSGHSLRESVQFANPVLAVPGTGLSATFSGLSILNPGQLANRTSATKFNWSGLEEPAANLDYTTLNGFSFSAKGATVTAGGSYSAHWLYTAYDQDKQANGGGYL